MGIPTADLFVDNVQEICSTFTFGAQQDPSEFLTFLLDHFILCSSSKQNFVNENPYNLIQQLFGIHIRRKTQCQICFNERSYTVWDSLLSISVDDHTDVTTAIKAFFKEELLTNENLYQCDHCTEKVPATTKFVIAKVSPTIFVHLQKFTFDESTQMVTKLHRFISFPKILNVNLLAKIDDPDLNGRNNSSIDFTYELYAVVVHKGRTPSSGHIFAYIRSPDGSWYEANDETVTAVELNVVLGAEDAYILCYGRTSAEPSLTLSKTSINSPIISSAVVTSTPMNSRSNERKQLHENFHLVRTQISH